MLNQHMSGISEDLTQFCSVLYCCLAVLVLDPRVGHTMDILSPLNEVVDALAPNSFPFFITVAVDCTF